MSEPYGHRGGDHRPSLSTGAGSSAALGGARDRSGSVQPAGEAITAHFTSFLRIRPYNEQELKECRQAKQDTDRSAIELDEANDKILILDTNSLLLKPQRCPPKKVWSPSEYDKLVWSFAVDPWKRQGKEKEWAEDIDHNYMDNAALFDAVNTVGRSASIVDQLYAGYNQCVMAHGAVGTGKSYTIFGETADPGIATRVITELHQRRGEAEAKAGEGEQITVDIDVSLLRVWKENIEDVTQWIAEGGRGTPPKLRLTADGRLEGLSPMSISGDTELRELVQLLFRYGRRKERRAHAVVHVTLTQTSEFAAEADGEDGDLSTKAQRVSTLTFVDVGAGTKTETETAVEAKAITKARNTLIRCFELLKQKTEVEESAERVNAEWGRTSSVTGPKIPYKESRLTDLLSEQLGGNCQTVVICTISPVPNAENTLTIEFGRTAHNVRSKFFKNEAKALQKLRQMNLEKGDMVRKMHVVNQDVVKVQTELTDRQRRINLEKERGQQLAYDMANLEEMIAGCEQHKTNSAQAIGVVRVMNENTTTPLLTRLHEAMQEGEGYRKECNRIRNEILAMECETGDRDVEDMQKEIDKAKEFAAEERGVVAGAIQKDALALVKRDDLGASVGDLVQAGGASGTITKVEGDEVVVKGLDVSGRFERSLDKKTVNIRGGQVHLAAVLLDLEFPDHPSLDGTPGLYAKEVEYAIDRLSDPIAEHPEQPPSLKGQVSKIAKDFELCLADYMKDQGKKLGCSSDSFHGTSQAILKAMREADDFLAKRVADVMQKEAEVSKREAELNRAGEWPPLAALTQLGSSPPPSIAGLQLSWDIVKVTRARLEVLLDLHTLRSALHKAVEQWNTVVDAGPKWVVDSRKEREAARKRAEEGKGELEKATGEVKAKRSEIDKVNTDIGTKTGVKSAKEKELKKAQGCVVM